MNIQPQEELKLHNLNHLLPLWALLTTSSVSHAANKAGIAQPTMSKILGSLRHELGDALLIREGNAMRLTPFATALLPRLSLAIEQLNDVYAPATDFDPSNTSASIRVGANDYVIATVGIPWLKRIANKAPKLKIDFRPIGLVYPEQLLSSESLDLAIGPKLPNMNLRRASLFADPFVCVAAGDNTVTPEKITLDQFLSHRHIDISPTGTGLTRAWLEKKQPALKGRRQVWHALSLYLTLPEVIANSLDLAVVPSRFLTAVPAGALRIIDLDFKLPTYEVSAWWHNRMHHDMMLQWARDELLQVAKEVHGH